MLSIKSCLIAGVKSLTATLINSVTVLTAEEAPLETRLAACADKELKALDVRTCGLIQSCSANALEQLAVAYKIVSRVDRTRRARCALRI